MKSYNLTSDLRWPFLLHHPHIFTYLLTLPCSNHDKLSQYVAYWNNPLWPRLVNFYSLVFFTVSTMASQSLFWWRLSSRWSWSTSVTLPRWSRMSHLHTTVLHHITATQPCKPTRKVFTGNSLVWCHFYDTSCRHSNKKPNYIINLI